MLFFLIDVDFGCDWISNHRNVVFNKYVSARNFYHQANDNDNDNRRYERYCWKSLKNSGLQWGLNLWSCDAGATLKPTELESHWYSKLV